MTIKHNTPLQADQVREIITKVASSLDISLSTDAEEVEGLRLCVFSFESPAEDGEAVRKAINQFIFHLCHTKQWPTSYVVEHRPTEIAELIGGSSAKDNS